MKETEPRAIVGYFIVLLIVAIIAMNQELSFFLPIEIKVFGAVVIGYITYSIVKTELERPPTRK